MEAIRTLLQKDPIAYFSVVKVAKQVCHYVLQ